MTNQESLICAFHIDGVGSAEPVGWPELGRIEAQDEGFLWLHLNRQAAETRRWLSEDSGLPSIVCDFLLSAATRPRCTPLGDGFVLNLRGVNLNPGAHEEDMVSLRMWIQPGLIISTRLRHIQAIQDLREEISAGRPPQDVGEFVYRVCHRLLKRTEPVVASLDDQTDRLEELILAGKSDRVRGNLTNLREKTVKLRRYLHPQREALNFLAETEINWLDDGRRELLFEIANASIRLVESLDQIRERAVIIHDELVRSLSRKSSQALYMVSLVAGVFLPLDFVTGLLGMNLGFIPWTSEPWAFTAVCAFLGAIVAFELWLFRRFQWI